MKALLIAVALTLTAAPAMAQDKQTVSALIADGYEVKGVIPSNAGPGILLEKDGHLVMCFVAETPSSENIETQYCKPVV